MTGSLLTQPQTSGQVFDGATKGARATLTGDLFQGSNLVSGGSVAISSSQIRGTLTVTNSRVTLTGVTGGDVTAVNSTIVLVDSSLGTLTLTGSNVTLTDSSYAQVSPAQASVTFGSIPSQPASGKFDVTVNVAGSLLSAGGVSMQVDGTNVTPSVSASASGLTVTVALDAASLADGVHTVAVTVTQSDGISTSASTFVTTNSHISTLDSGLQQAGQQIANLTAQQKANSEQLGAAMNFTYGLGVVAVVAVAVALMALRKTPRVAA